MFNGWMIPDDERAKLLALFPPRFANIRMSHVTHMLDENSLPLDAEVEVVGYACDRLTEALVVHVNGSRHRPDGGIYHITVSFVDGMSAKTANEMILRTGWFAVEPVPIRTKAFISRGETYITTPLTQLTL